MKKGLVSVLIVNWNERNFLPACFNSILKQDYKKIEVIIVDNASTDGSKEVLEEYSKRWNFKLINSSENLGFAAGNNLALKYAQGEYIMLLNVDTTFGKKLINILVGFLKQHSRAALVQPKLVFMSDHKKLDNVGAYLTWTGIPYYFGLYKDANNPKYNQDLKVYSAKGACMMIKRSVIERVGFLDDYMFIFFEESDFCHRVWLSGYECWYSAKAVVNHFVGATLGRRDNFQSIFFGHRNRIRSFLKNFELRTLIILIPVHILMLLGVSIVEVLRGNWRRAVSVSKAILTNLIILPNTLSERALIQKRVRKIKDQDIASIIFKNPRLEYYLHVGGDLANYQD